MIIEKVLSTAYNFTRWSCQCLALDGVAWIVKHMNGKIYCKVIFTRCLFGWQ